MSVSESFLALFTGLLAVRSCDALEPPAGVTFELARGAA